MGCSLFETEPAFRSCDRIVNDVELRCDTNRSKLLAKVKKPVIVDGNLIEVACDDCKRRKRKLGEVVSLVVHRFNVLGDLIETEVFR